MKKVFICVLIVFGLPQIFKIQAQESKQPFFNISLRGNFTYDNLLNFEEVECVIYEKTLGDKGVKATLRIDERFAERNRSCDLPVLQLNLPKKKLKGSVLEGFNKVEIIPICRLSNRYNSSDKLLIEAWLYHLAGIMFRMEPRAQIVSLKLPGFSENEADASYPALFLESPEDLAQRFEGQNLELHFLQPWLLDQEAWAEFLIFQHFTHNSRWALETLHSMVLLSVPGKPPVPYPLDNSGAGILNLASDSLSWADFGSINFGTCVQKDAFLEVAGNLTFYRDEIIQSIDNLNFVHPEVGQQLKAYVLRFYAWLDEVRAAKNTDIICPEE